MANPITKIEQDVLNSTLRSLGEAGATTDHANWIRKRGNAQRLIQFINEQIDRVDKNPYEMTVEAQIIALRRANDEENWEIGMTEADFNRLASSAPAWPKGKHTYRSLRIRFGEGDEGVAETFEAHCKRIQNVFGKDRYDRSWILTSDVKGLRLLNGNHTHDAVIEWVVVDLNTHRKRESIRAVRDSKSLADELLVIAWMFPDMIRAIDYGEFPGLLAAGYEVNLDFSDPSVRMSYNRWKTTGQYAGFGEETWQQVVLVGFFFEQSRVDVLQESYKNNLPHYSVPRLR